MEVPVEQRKCDHHKEINIAFYCFDDNSFLCSKCFKEHKKHNIEIVDDLKEKDKIYKSLLAAKLNFTEYYIKLKNILKKVHDEVKKCVIVGTGAKSLKELLEK